MRFLLRIKTDAYCFGMSKTLTREDVIICSMRRRSRTIWRLLRLLLQSVSYMEMHAEAAALLHAFIRSVAPSLSHWLRCSHSDWLNLNWFLVCWSIYQFPLDHLQAWLLGSWNRQQSFQIHSFPFVCASILMKFYVIMQFLFEESINISFNYCLVKNMSRNISSSFANHSFVSFEIEKGFFTISYEMSHFNS